MSYSFRRNKNGDLHLLTGQKAKDKDIIIKMGSTIASIHIVDALTRETYALTWTLEQNETNDEFLTLRAKIAGEIFNFDLNKDIIVKQFCKMVQENLTLESCTYLGRMLEECYNVIFLHFFEANGYFFAASNPVKGYTIIKHNNKIIGTANRFSFDSSNRLCVYEYTGKEITRDMTLNIQVILNDSKVKFIAESQRNSEPVIFDPNIDTLGYFSYNARIQGIGENDIEIPEIIELNYLPKIFTNKNEMNSYVRNNNSTNEITAYKISLKPKIEIIDINKFMLREFTV